MNRSSRFLCCTILLAAACAFVACTSAFGADDRSYFSASYVLTLDGTNCGLVKSVEGGAIGAEVIDERAGTSYFFKKHIGAPKYEAFSFDVGMNLSADVYSWIADSWATAGVRKGGSIAVVSRATGSGSQRNFTNALLAETTIPAFEGGSKEPCYITLKLEPESTISVTPTVTTAGYAAKGASTLMLPSNFMLAIDGLDCRKVSKIDSFTVKQAVVSDVVGDARDTEKTPGKLRFPDLKITLSEVSAGSWNAWHQDFVVHGNNDDSKEKNGSLVILGRDGKTELARINFFNLGIYRIEPQKLDDKADSIRRVVADLYCERMEFVYAGPTGKPATVAPDTDETPADTTPTTTVETRADTTLDRVKPLDAGLSKMPIRSLPAELDSTLTEVHKFGGEDGLELALKGLDFTVTREPLGDDEEFCPPAKSKLMLVHYTMRNPSDAERNVSWNTITFAVTDSTGVNHKYSGVSVGSEKQGLDTSLMPGQALDCCATIVLPARVDAKTLIVSSFLDPAVKSYDVAGKIGLIEPYAMDASAKEGGRFTALSEVPISMREYYPMVKFDYRIDSTAYGTFPSIDEKPTEGTRCLFFNFTIRNALKHELRYEYNTFSPILMMSDGTTIPWNRYLLSSKVDEAISGPLGENVEMGMRVFFEVPTIGEVKPVSFNFAEGDSRVYVLPISGL